MPDNFYMYFVTALIPLAVGAVYYNPKVFGTAWMNVNGFTEESLKGANMAKIFGLSYIFGILMSFILGGIVIHQSGVVQTMMGSGGEFTAEAAAQANALLAQYGHLHRSFGHGVLHGVIFALFFVWPLLGINALFERRGAKYIAIHLGYWVISLALMGGILCSTLVYSPIVAS